MPKFHFHVTLSFESNDLDSAYAHLVQSIKGPEFETDVVVMDGTEVPSNELDDVILSWTDRHMSNKDPVRLLRKPQSKVAKRRTGGTK